MDPADFASLLEREPAPTNAYTLELESRLAEEIKGHNLANATAESQALYIKSLEGVLVAIRAKAAQAGSGRIEDVHLRREYALADIARLVAETLDPCKPWCVLAEEGKKHEGACIGYEDLDAATREP